LEKVSGLIRSTSAAAVARLFHLHFISSRLVQSSRVISASVARHGAVAACSATAAAFKPIAFAHSLHADSMQWSIEQ